MHIYKLNFTFVSKNLYADKLHANVGKTKPKQKKTKESKTKEKFCRKQSQSRL